MRPLAALELQLRERKPRSRSTRAHTVIPAAAGDGVGRNEEMPPGISRLPITQAGVPAFARTGGVSSTASSHLPPQQGMENVFPKSWQNPQLRGSAGSGSNGRAPGPWVTQGRLVGMGAEGIPVILSPFLASTASSQGRAERELGLAGPDGASAPCSPHAQAASLLRMCRRSREPSGELGECKRYLHL